MSKYKYTGDNEVHIHGVGIVKPGETIETDLEINHPNFEKVESKQKKEDK